MELKYEYNVLKQYKQEKVKLIDCTVGKIKKVNVLSLISDVFIKEDDGKKDERGEKVHFEPHIDISVEGSKADVKVQTVTRVDVDVDIAIDIKVDLPAIQDDFAELKEAIANANPKLEKELDKIQDSLDEVSAEDEKNELKKPMNKMRRFLEKVADEKSDFHKAIKGAKKGIEMAQKVGKTYNKFAPWLGLLPVPDLFLGKQNK